MVLTFVGIAMAVISTMAWIPALAQTTVSDAEYARISTSLGDIDVKLARQEAPLTTENFLEYATSGYYDRLLFHRVIDGVLIQGGGYNRSLRQRPTRDPIQSEARNGLSNKRGTIAMARFDNPDSATSQFFINLRDNPDLDPKPGDRWRDAGYTVFGQIVSGLDVADAIGAVQTGPSTTYTGDIQLDRDFPLDPVYILRIDPIGEDEVEAPAP